MTAARRIVVPPERLPRWLENFAARHGPPSWSYGSGSVQTSCPDGAEAVLAPPFGPVVGELPEALLDHVRRERVVGALLVRRGGAGVGVFEGRRLVASKIETSYVQSRTKAGGWSQQRYARRRGNQARRVWSEAAELVVGLVLPRLPDLDGVAVGGDQEAVAEVLADSRLAPLRPLVMPAVHPVPDPRLAVLQEFPDRFLGIQISLNALA